MLKLFAPLKLISFLIVIEKFLSSAVGSYKVVDKLPPLQFDATSSRRNLDNYENEIRTFTNYKLARIIPFDKDVVEYLETLFLSDTPPYELDFWQPPSRVGAFVDVTVAPEDARAFFHELDLRNVEYFIIADNLQSLIINERYYDLHYEPSTKDSYHYDRYNPLTTIETQIFHLRDENPGLITIFDIGQTHENRSIYTVKVSNHATRRDPWKSALTAVWLDGGIHAREWIASATAMNILKKLVSGYNSADPEFRRIMESTDWYITPVLNPDGYEYSHTKNRMWRKNRRPASCRFKRRSGVNTCCAGVDLNRNFDWHFGTTGSSDNPCHETYRGLSAFSEPESRALRDFLEKVKVHAFITLHSYSQLWLIPYGHRRQTYPEDFDSFLRPLSLRATNAMNRLYGTKYNIGTGADLLYEASGASHDYAKGSLKIPYSFLLELRPQNSLLSTGFLLPESEILATGEETWMALKVVADEIVDRFIKLPATQMPKITSIQELSTSASFTSSSSAATIPNTQSLSSLTRTFLTLETTIPTTLLTTVKSTITTKSLGNSTTYHRHTLRPSKNFTSVEENASSLSSSRSSLSFSIPSSLSSLITRSMPNSINIEAHSMRPLGSSEFELVLMIGVRSGKQIHVLNTTREVLPMNGTKNIAAPFTVDKEISTTMLLTTTRSHITPGDFAPTRKTVVCHDFSYYCKWWKIHGLCERSQVSQKCTLSCLIECQI